MAQAAGQRLPLLVGHDREVDVDRAHALERGDGLGDAPGDLRAERAAGHRQGDGDLRPCRRRRRPPAPCRGRRSSGAARGPRPAAGPRGRSPSVGTGTPSAGSLTPGAFPLRGIGRIPAWPADPEHAAESPAARAMGLQPEEFSAAVSAVTTAFGDPPGATSTCSPAAPAPQGMTAQRRSPSSFALHPNVARHHLEKLTAGGYLRPWSWPATSRPGGRRSATAPASSTPRSTFPPRRDDLLATLLARALELLDPRRGRRHGRGGRLRVRPRARRARWRLGASGDTASSQRSVRAAVATVADALTAHGFAAHTEARGGSLTIVSEHCPFGEAAKQYPHVVCAVDRGMIRGMLAGLYGETASSPHPEPARRRRPLRRPRVIAVPRLSRPRVHLAAAPGCARGDAAVPARPPRRPGDGSTPRAG